MNLWDKLVTWFRVRNQLRKNKKKDPFIYK